ncbi:MAG: Bifunctional hemolysin/adenylate cyclase precursor [Deinococcota bacterium]|jgi:uncharacterized delta-60 repeat protein
MKLGIQISALVAFGLLTVSCQQPIAPNAAFKLKPAETTLEIPAGGEGTSFVALERDAGFTDLVQMSFEGLPAGFEQEWTRDASNGDCGLRLKIGKEVAPGEYNLKLVAIDGVTVRNGLKVQATSASVTTNIKVVVPQASVYTLTTSPSVFSAEPGFTGKFGINVREIDPTFSGNVQLTLENLPLGVSAVFNKTSVPTLNPPSTSTALVTLNVANSTLPGTYAMKLVGIANGIIRSSLVQLTVEPTTTQGFKLSTTTVDGTVLQEFGSNITVNIERKAGFTAPVVISAQGLAEGARVENVSSNNTSSVVKLFAGLNTPSGTQGFTLKGTGGGIIQTVPVETNVVSRFDQPKTSNLGANALDSSFNSLPLAGFKSVPNVNGRVSLRQPDGKILVTATTGALTRLNADGTPDSTFVPSTTIAFTIIDQLVLQADNKILIQSGTEIIRLNPNGSLDSTFGTNGRTELLATTLVSKVLSFAQVELGRLLFITSTELIRLTPGGNLDPDFDGDGRKTISIPGVNSPSNPPIALTDSLGRFLVISESISSVINVSRILQDGTVDSTYTSPPIDNAKLNLNLIASRSRVTLDSQGRLLMLIKHVTNEVFSVVRLTANGSLDTSFDTDGRIDISFNANLHTPRAITALANNKIMMVGAANTNDFAAIRLNENGSLDNTFGTGGKVLLGFNSPSNLVTGSFDAIFTGVIGLPDSSAMTFGTGPASANSALQVVTKFKP